MKLLVLLSIIILLLLPLFALLLLLSIELGPTITDTLWLLGMMVQSSDTDESSLSIITWKRLCNLVKALSSSGLVDILLLKTSLELNLLCGAGLTKDEVIIIYL